MNTIDAFCGPNVRVTGSATARRVFESEWLDLNDSTSHLSKVLAALFSCYSLGMMMQVFRALRGWPRGIQRPGQIGQEPLAACLQDQRADCTNANGSDAGQPSTGDGEGMS
jgi:hypothetical protein